MIDLKGDVNLVISIFLSKLVVIGLVCACPRLETGYSTNDYTCKEDKRSQFYATSDLSTNYKAHDWSVGLIGDKIQ